MVIVRPNQRQIKQVFDLILRSDIAEHGEPDIELSDLRHDWGRLDLEQDAWLAKDDQGEIRGYSAVVPSRGEIRFDLYIDPEHGDQALARKLLQLAEGHARASANDGEISGHTFLAHVNQRDRGLFEGAGFTYVKSHFQMHVELTEALAQPQWPAGVHVRTAVPEEDDRAIYYAIQKAFERTDDETTFDQWREHMIRSEVYDPELWLLAVSGDNIVGTCLGIKYENEGWIRQFGVVPDRRGEGIATAMLRHAFIVFRDRGYQRVGLGMEAGNKRALRLYDRVGMKVLRQYDEYAKTFVSDGSGPLR